MGLAAEPCSPSPEEVEPGDLGGPKASQTSLLAEGDLVSRSVAPEE